MVERLDLTQQLEPLACLLDSAQPQIELPELLERLRISRIRSQRRFPVSISFFDLALLECVAP